MSLSIQDKFEIQELINRYAHNADFNSPETMRDIFTEDGRFCVAAMDIDVHGIDNIIQFFTSMRDALTGIHHITTGTIIDAGDDSNSAVASSYIQTVQVNEGATSIASIGRYQDQLQRGESGWRFLQREILM